MYLKKIQNCVTVCFHLYEFQEQAKLVCSKRYQKSVCLGEWRAGEESRLIWKEVGELSGLMEMVQPWNIAGEGGRGTGYVHMA